MCNETGARDYFKNAPWGLAKTSSKPAQDTQDRHDTAPGRRRTFKPTSYTYTPTHLHM